jgi:hypothetical protein
MNRVQQRRGQKLPPGVRSVARPSRWGNPFRLPNEADRARVLACYREWLDLRLASDPGFLEPLRGAAGLACYCSPDVDCHADIIIARLAARPPDRQI